MIDDRHVHAERAAEVLWRRWQSGSSGSALPEEIRPTTLSEAWAVQVAFTRMAGGGMGWKVAASSPAGQRHIGVSGPIAGPLIAGGLRQSGDMVPLTRMASAEPEIAFRLGAELSASGAPHRRDDVLAAVSDVLPAIEIPDCRYDDVTTVGEAQLVADLACAAFVVLGPPLECWEFSDLRLRRVAMRVNGQEVSVGVGSNALGDPVHALLWLVDVVTRAGSDLLAGDVVITGAAAPPVTVRAGDIVDCVIDGAVLTTATLSVR